MRFRFGDYLLDVDRRELRRGGEPVEVEPQVFDLLAHVIRHRDRVVSKDDLLASVWHGRIVSDSTLSSRINAARRAIGDSGEEQRWIRTVARHGIRFVGEAREEGGAGEAAPAAPTAPPAAPTAAPAPRQDVTFCRTADGVTLAVATAGSGPVLVKTANWLNHVEQDWVGPIFSPLLHRLAERNRLIRYDGRGNGLSDWEVGEISFEAFVRDLETVIDSLGLHRFSLFGISQGAAVAVAYAARHPDRVEKLVLYGAYAQGRNKRGSAAEREKAQALLTLMRHGWGDEHSPFMQAFSSVYVPSGSAEQVRWWAHAQRITTSAEIAVRIRQACDDIDVVDLLPQVQAPTLVLHNRHDHVAPFDGARRIAAAIPNARFVSLESDNHVLLAGEPAWPQFMEEIERFLAS